MINKVSKQMSECKTLDDKEQLYEQLYEIREGFKDYAPTNSINELNIILEDMKKEIMNEQSKKQELVGVRSNTSRPDGKNSSIAKK